MAARVTLAALALPAVLAAQAAPAPPDVDALAYTFRLALPDAPDRAPLAAHVTAHLRRRPGTTAVVLDLVRAMTVDSARTAFGDNFPDRARQWLAVIDRPGDKALVEWDVIAPATHRVVANGERLSEGPHPAAPGMTRTRWRTARPLYPAVMVIGVAPFTVLELGPSACGLAERAGCVDQTLWVRPSAVDAMPGPFARAGDITAWLSRLVGPFPYAKLAHVQSSTRYGGMENAGAIFYADGLFAPGRMRESLVAHETAHQWFGDAVTTATWPHVWLSEGFATYYAARWFEHAHGAEAFARELAAMRATVLRAAVTDTKPVIDTTLGDDLSELLSTNVYQRAGYVLHLLREEIGDRAFDDAVRAYYVAHRHGTATTDDFRRAAEAASGRPLDWFFDQWLRRAGLPTLAVSWTAANGALEVTLRQPGDRTWRTPLVLAVETSAGAVRQCVVVPATATHVLRIPLADGARVTRVVADPDGTLLGRVLVEP
jgi:aminopeptidase N